MNFLIDSWNCGFVIMGIYATIGLYLKMDGWVLIPAILVSLISYIFRLKKENKK